VAIRRLEHHTLELPPFFPAFCQEESQPVAVEGETSLEIINGKARGNGAKPKSLRLLSFAVLRCWRVCHDNAPGSLTGERRPSLARRFAPRQPGCRPRYVYCSVDTLIAGRTVKSRHLELFHDRKHAGIGLSLASVHCSRASCLPPGTRGNQHSFRLC